jgi:hypothetical protein
MQQVQLKDVKQGVIIQRKLDSKSSYIRNHYDRASKTYSLTSTDDINKEIFLKPSTTVFIDE